MCSRVTLNLYASNSVAQSNCWFCIWKRVVTNTTITIACPYADFLEEGLIVEWSFFDRNVLCPTVIPTASFRQLQPLIYRTISETFLVSILSRGLCPSTPVLPFLVFQTGWARPAALHDISLHVPSNYLVVLVGAGYFWCGLGQLAVFVAVTFFCVWLPAVLLPLRASHYSIYTLSTCSCPLPERHQERNVMVRRTRLTSTKLLSKKNTVAETTH